MLSSKDLQEAFIIKPDIEYSVGNERLKKNGEKTGTKYTESYLCYDIFELEDELENVLEKSIVFLKSQIKNDNFLKSIKKTGGRMILYIAVYTKDHFSTILPYNFTQYCSELGILVGLEIFNTFLDD